MRLLLITAQDTISITLSDRVGAEGGVLQKEWSLEDKPEGSVLVEWSEGGLAKEWVLCQQADGQHVVKKAS